jgi:hypothetical protein
VLRLYAVEWLPLRVTMFGNGSQSSLFRDAFGEANGLSD